MASSTGRIDDESGPAAPALRTRDGRLLEREAEICELGSLLGEVRTGRGGVSVVEGPAGIGKSRLLGAVREDALAAGMLPLRARPSQLELDYPFGVVRQLFEPALARIDDPEPLFAGAAALARQVVDPSTVASAHEEDRFGVLHGLYWLTANLADRDPLLVAVDDLQWCDSASLLFLAYLVRRVEDVPVAVLVAVRTGERVADDEAFEAVTSHGSARRHRLQPLSERAVCELVRSGFGREPDEVFSRACRDATAGNPLLLHELVGALVAAGVAPTEPSVGELPEIGADAVSRFVVRRLERLPDTARNLAVAVAVLGSRADVEEAASLAGIDRASAADATAALVHADLLRDGAVLRFVHPLVREAVYGTMAPSERERAHSRAVLVLQERQASPERVALHLMHAPPGRVAGAVDMLRASARQSLAKGAPAGAVAFLERALEEPLDPAMRIVILRESGDAALRVDPRAATAYLRQAIDLLKDPAERAEVGLQLGRALYGSGAGDAAVEVLERALAEAPASATELQHHLEYELSNALYGSVRLKEALERGRRLYERPPSGGGAGSRALFATLAWVATFLPCPRQEAVRFATAALADDLLLDEDNSDAFWSAAWVLLVAEEYDLARATVDRALARAVPRGALQWFVWSVYYRSRLSFSLGELIDAEADMRSALEAAESSGLAVGTPWLAAQLGDVLRERGQLDAASAVVEPPRSDRQHALNVLLVTRAEIRLAKRQLPEALADLEEFHRRYESAGADNRMSPWRPVAAQVLAALERRDEALAMAREEVELARRWGAPRPLGRALRVLGELEHGVRGLELLRDAVVVLDGSRARLEYAHALAALGAALRRGGQRVEARDLLRSALDLAAATGAEPLAGRAQDELIAAGGRPRRDPIESRSALTASELRVARMAVEGMTNREIAQALFLSLKTIETHLSSAFRKLDIGSRQQLAGALPASGEPVAR